MADGDFAKPLPCGSVRPGLMAIALFDTDMLLRALCGQILDRLTTAFGQWSAVTGSSKLTSYLA